MTNLIKKGSRVVLLLLTILLVVFEKYFCFDILIGFATVFTIDLEIYIDRE